VTNFEQLLAALKRLVADVESGKDPRLYVRFTLSFRDVEDLLAERGITVLRNCSRW
jgi:hypothetical protein